MLASTYNPSTWDVEAEKVCIGSKSGVLYTVRSRPDWATKSTNNVTEIVIAMKTLNNFKRRKYFHLPSHKRLHQWREISFTVTKCGFQSKVRLYNKLIWIITFLIEKNNNLWKRLWYFLFFITWKIEFP